MINVREPAAPGSQSSFPTSVRAAPDPPYTLIAPPSSAPFTISFSLLVAFAPVAIVGVRLLAVEGKVANVHKPFRLQMLPRHGVVNTSAKPESKNSSEVLTLAVADFTSIDVVAYLGGTITSATPMKMPCAFFLLLLGVRPALSSQCGRSKV